MTVTVTPQGCARVVALDREHRRNAIDHPLRDALLEQLRTRPTQDERLLVLRAHGAIFSAGNDLRMLGEAAKQDGPLGLSSILLRDVELLRAFEASLLPTVALVDGGVYGFATEVVAACDWIAASKRATFSWPEWKFGIIPAGISALRLGRRFAWQALPTGLDAAAAHAAGFVDELVESDGLEQRVVTIEQWVRELSREAYEGWRALVLQMRRPAPGVWERLPGIWTPHPQVGG